MNNRNLIYVVNQWDEDRRLYGDSVGTVHHLACVSGDWRTSDGFVVWCACTAAWIGNTWVDAMESLRGHILRELSK